MEEHNKEKKNEDIDPQAKQRLDYINRFTYHQPKQEFNQTDRYTGIREMAKRFSLHLAGECPQSRELSLAITKLEEVMFWANASIARNE